MTGQKSCWGLCTVEWTARQAGKGQRRFLRCLNLDVLTGTLPLGFSPAQMLFSWTGFSSVSKTSLAQL